MARQEADREDLFAEAVALVERAELAIPGIPQPVTAGRRRTGGWSVYFGADPCFHFDESGRLRRAFLEGRLYRTQGRTLAELERVQTPEQTELRRRDLTSMELALFLDRAQRRLTQLHESVCNSTIRLQRVFPPESDVTGALEQALTRILRPALRLAPAIKGRP